MSEKALREVSAAKTIEIVDTFIPGFDHSTHNTTLEHDLFTARNLRILDVGATGETVAFKGDVANPQGGNYSFRLSHRIIPIPSGSLLDALGIKDAAAHDSSPAWFLDFSVTPEDEERHLVSARWIGLPERKSRMLLINAGLTNDLWVVDAEGKERRIRVRRPTANIEPATLDLPANLSLSTMRSEVMHFQSHPGAAYLNFGGLDLTDLTDTHIVTECFVRYNARAHHMVIPTFKMRMMLPIQLGQEANMRSAH